MCSTKTSETSVLENYIKKELKCNANFFYKPAKKEALNKELITGHSNDKNETA